MRIPCALTNLTNEANLGALRPAGVLSLVRWRHHHAVDGGQAGAAIAWGGFHGVSSDEEGSALALLDPLRVPSLTSTILSTTPKVSCAGSRSTLTHSTLLLHFNHQESIPRQYQLYARWIFPLVFPESWKGQYFCTFGRREIFSQVTCCWPLCSIQSTENLRIR